MGKNGITQDTLPTHQLLLSIQLLTYLGYGPVPDGDKMADPVEGLCVSDIRDFVDRFGAIKAESFV